MDPCKICRPGHRKLGTRNCERHGLPIADLEITTLQLLTEAHERIASLEKSKEELETEVEEVSTKVNEWEDRVVELESRASDLEYVLDKYAKMTLAEWELIRGRYL